MSDSQATVDAPEAATVDAPEAVESTSKEDKVLTEETKPEGKVEEHDFVIVFRNPEHEKGKKLLEKQADGNLPKTYKDFVSAVSKVGVQVQSYLSCQGDEVYVLLSATVSRYADQADAIDYKMLLNEAALSKECDEYFKKFENEILNGVPRQISQYEDSRFRKYEYMYGTYNNDEPNQKPIQHLFEKAPGRDHPFRSTDKIKLLMSMVESPTYKGGAGINIDLSLEAKAECVDVDDESDKYGWYGMLSAFPLHDPADLNNVYNSWVKLWQWPSDQPVDLLRSYFGEKAGLYFAFLCHYTSWLGILAGCGLIVGIDILIEWSTEATLVPYFALVVSFWTVFFLEAWKNREVTLAMKWGMSDYESLEQDRPEFHGEKMWSPVDGSLIYYYSDTKRRETSLRNWTVIALMIALVFGSVFGVYYLKVLFDYNEYYEESIPITIQAVIIQILNAIYRVMARKMTDAENHQTDTQFEDSLVNKLYCFTFVNSYGALFFIAFVAEYTELGCEYGSCFADLAYEMSIIFLSNLVVLNVTDVVLPILSQRAKAAKEMEGVDPNTTLSKAEIEYTLGDYDPIDDSIEDFTVISIEFGYVVLFATAFPAAPILAYINQYLQIRTDGWKLTRATKRCLPSGAQDIGIWLTIFTATAYAAVISNSAIVCFVDPTLIGWMKGYEKVWFFIIFQYTIILFMNLLAIAIPDIPDDVSIQTKRSAWIDEVLIKQVPQEDEKIDGTSYGLFKEPTTVKPGTLPNDKYFGSIEQSLFERSLPQ